MHDVLSGYVERGELPGAYGWEGGFGTTWRADPTEELVMILMTQVAGTTGVPRVFGDFVTLAYAAIDD